MDMWGFAGGAGDGVGGSSIGGATEGWGVDNGGVGVGVRKVILLVTQSINGLCRVSQLYPRTIDHDGSNGVTKNSIVRVSPDGNWTGMVTLSEMRPPGEPSKRRSCFGGSGDVLRLCCLTKFVSMKQWVEPESIKVITVQGDGVKTEERGIIRESEDGEEALRRTIGSA
jgi:hypothetical protein